MGRYGKKISAHQNNMEPRVCPGCEKICFLKCTGTCSSSCIGTQNLKARSEKITNK